ncbi:MAG: NRDE family protein [Gammaproteobacteria bacterium]|nr:NRDE family protein [Gammaproteobacteria bacterium]
MCLIFIAHRHSDRYPLVVAANRDEFHQRPAAPAGFWQEAPEILAGRDLTGGGTWLGLSRGGRVAAVTNFREPRGHRADAPTRGALVTDFLSGGGDPLDYLHAVAARGSVYNGFNLIAGDLDVLGWYSNRGGEPRALSPGIYGISNHLLDTPWMKVVQGKSRFCDWLDQSDPDPEDLLELLRDETVADDTMLPDTGVGIDQERTLSPIFIRGERYGTRSSTVLMIDAGRHATFIERSFDAGGNATGTVAFDFELTDADSDRPRRAGAGAV